MKSSNRQPLAYEIIARLAEAAQALECFWRTSDRSFSGCVAEVWFDDLQTAGEFARVCSDRIGINCKVRATSDGPAKFYVSVPCW